MRINNDVRNYVRKAVNKKAEAKRNELVDEFNRVNKEYNILLCNKREVVKDKLKQLCDEARTELVKYAKSIGCNMVKSSDRDLSYYVSPSNYDIDNYITVDGKNLVDEASNRIKKLDISINEKVDEILFKLSIGGDYDSIVDEINNIKF